MKKEIKNKIDTLDGGMLEVFCFDSIKLKDKTTFDSCAIKDIRVAYWAEDEENVDERLAGMFDILFQEVIKNRSKKPDSDA